MWCSGERGFGSTNKNSTDFIVFTFVGESWTEGTEGRSVIAILEREGKGRK